MAHQIMSPGRRTDAGQCDDLRSRRTFDADPDIVGSSMQTTISYLTDDPCL